MGNTASTDTDVPLYSRAAHHAGSWYDSTAEGLEKVLQKFLDDAEQDSKELSLHSKSLRGLICPHAGFSYSGSTAGHAYQVLSKELSKKDTPIKRILVLHPSHHVYLDRCAVSGASELETPLGNLQVDQEFKKAVLNLAEKPEDDTFLVTSQKEDEGEHSGEMQYPFIYKVLKDVGKLDDIKILPIMCGALSVNQETRYGSLLAKYVARQDVLTVVSTDFCHWGSRFSYQPTDNSFASGSGIPIHEYIKLLDRKGMDHISMKEPGAFAQYIKETRNSICGKHAVAVWLRAVTASEKCDSLEVEFLSYAQSSEVKSMSDSSVSYAVAIACAPILK
jgi:AmmeMemoRadiSam system protein B